MQGIKEAKQLIQAGKVKRISDRMWEVNEHIVAEKLRSGRTLTTCDCINHTEYASYRQEPSICKHKRAVIIFEFLRELKEEKL